MEIFFYCCNIHVSRHLWQEILLEFQGHASLFGLVYLTVFYSVCVGRGLSGVVVDMMYEDLLSIDGLTFS